MKIDGAVYDDGLDIVVVNYRTPTLLQDFVVSTAKNIPSTPINFTIYNVAPDYESYRYAEACKLIGIDHIWNPENVGYARAVNHCVSQMNRECIAIFNSDTKFTYPILDECYEQLMSHEDWGVLGPKQINERNQITNAGITGTNENPHMRWWKQPDNSTYSIVDEDCVSTNGSAYFIKRAVWDVVTKDPSYIRAHQQILGENPEGAFPSFHHYYEDMMCSLMVRNLGFKVTYYGLATMVHLWHQSSEVGSDVDKNMNTVREPFRKMLDIMGIEHE